MKTITRKVILITAIISSFSFSPLKAQEVQYSPDGLSGTLDLDSYTNNIHSSWEINTGVNKFVKLTIETNTESGYDFVHLYNIDNDGNYNFMTTLSGQQSETMTTISPSGRVYIRFDSDGSICSDHGYTGFNIQFWVENPIVSYSYDFAGNRISRKIVPLNSNPQHVKKHGEEQEPEPVMDQLGERKITIYPNPTKGSLAVDITGGDDKDELRIRLYNADGKQLQNKKVEPGITPINMSSYPVAYYILRVMAGEKVKEFKIIKN